MSIFDRKNEMPIIAFADIFLILASSIQTCHFYAHFERVIDRLLKKNFFH